MGCGRCEKPKMSYRKGLWSPEEDQKLKDYILRHGHGCWSAVPAKAGLQRNGKSCRLRWINYLRPGLKHGIFSAEEEQIILSLHAMLGNKWSQIAMHLPGRTDNEVKNYWNSYVKKKVMKVEGAGPVKETKPPNWTHQSMETTQEEPNNQISNCESLGSLKLSSPDSGHSMTQRTEHSSPEGTPLQHFPKVLFADWLSMDYANSHILSDLDGEISMHFDSKNSNAEQSFKPGYSQEAGHPTDGFLHGFEDSSIDGKVRSQFEHVFGNPEDSVFDLLSMNETFLDMNYDDLSF